MLKRLLIIGIVVMALVALWFARSLRPVDSGNDTDVPFAVEQGQSVNTIAANLEAAGLIRSAFAFKIYTRLTGAQSALQAGAYTLQKSQSVSEIVSALHSGKIEDISITIPEGFTVADIDALLASKGLGREGDFIACAISCDLSDFSFVSDITIGDSAEKTIGTRVEGYLFPDTYSVAPSQYEPKSLMEQMLKNFENRVITPHKDDIAASGKSLHDIITMASLVEEEAITDAERPIIAGILYKRIEEGMTLGVDATNRYGAKKKRGEPLTRADLDTDGPYNTRTRQGLPPTPIANGGLESIEAALAPKSTDYLYYLHDPSGQIHYARTNDEHNMNRQRYLH